MLTACLCAQVRVRLQWTKDEPEEHADTSPSFAVEVGLCGVGISIVDASSLRLPREVKPLLAGHARRMLD